MKRTYMKGFLLFFGLVFIIASCKNRDAPHEINSSNSDTSAPATSDTSQIQSVKSSDTIKEIKVSYSIFPLTDSVMKFILDSLTTSEMEIVLALNRTDGASFQHSKSLAIPDTFLSDFNEYSPFPDSLPLIDSVKKLLLVSYRLQAFAAYDSGRLQHWGPTSMGKKSTPTPTGLFFTNWKKKKTISTEDSAWILKWYFNIENMRGISFHEFQLPGYPASHSCIRLRENDAQWIYYWADQWRLAEDSDYIVVYGTPVIIFGAYAFGKTPPWLKVDSVDASRLTVDSLTPAIKPFLDTLMQRQLRGEQFRLL